MLNITKNSLIEAENVLHAFLSKESNIDKIEETALIISEALSSGNKVISCGNGGSLCDATHFAEELTGRYRNNRRPYPAIAINDPAYITCTANDFSYNEIFSRYVEATGQKGDILLAISTSGNSENVINAIKKAQECGMKTVALTSEGNNQLNTLADIAIAAPKTAYSDRVQEIHIKVIHILIQLIESHLKH
jgi:D-sedoheptulose 7-phosphate isomerase